MSNDDYQRGSGAPGLGKYRGPSAVPDQLAPGQPPHPSEGYEGPAISVPLEWWQKQSEVIDSLGEQLARINLPDLVVGVATGNTDSSGNAVIGIYQVAAGLEAQLHRLTVNAINPSTGVAYTPAATYSNAEAYLEILQADAPQLSSLGFTGLIDFAPPITSVANPGPIFPGLFTDNSMQAGAVKGPMGFVLQVNAGPHSTLVMARYQVRIFRQHGIA